MASLPSNFEVTPSWLPLASLLSTLLKPSERFGKLSKQFIRNSRANVAHCARFAETLTDFEISAHTHSRLHVT